MLVSTLVNISTSHLPAFFKLFRGVFANTSSTSVPIPHHFINNGAETAPVWYASCWTGDLDVAPDSTPGVMRSDDQGASWNFINDGLYPGRLVWKFRKSTTVSNRFYAGMWGGGFMRLDE